MCCAWIEERKEGGTRERWYSSTYWTAGVREETATPWNPALRTAAEDRKARAILVPIGMESVAGFPILRIRSPANRIILRPVSVWLSTQ